MNTPSFDRIVNAIKTSPLQKKKLEKYLLTRDDWFFKQAEEFSIQYIGYLESESIPVEYAIEAYQKLCNDMMKCQIYFMKTGKYPANSSEEANENIYANETIMKLYMVGLAMSQFLWSSHYELYSCLIKSLTKYSKNIRAYLEIGPGHGVFLNKAVELIGVESKITVVDISSTSISITKSILNYFKQKNKNINYYNTVIIYLKLHVTYNFLTMGEVLEHVNFPEKLLLKLRDLLTERGRAFVSTCVNCPAIDHVYHFKSVGEIRDLLFNFVFSF